MPKTNLMAAVAACAMIATGAHATDDNATTGNINAAGTSSAMMQSELQVSSDDMLGSDLMGATVYNGAGQDDEAIGDVNDVLVGPDGTIKGLIIGVGGFLGIAEKDVAIPFSEVQQNADDQGMPRLTVETSRADLENAPAFDYGAVTPDAQLVTGTDTANTGNTSANGTTADMATNADTGMNATTDGPTNDLAQSEPADRGSNQPDGQAATQSDSQADTRTNNRAADQANDQSANTQAASQANRENMEQLASEDLRADDLLEATVYGVNGDDVGDIGDVIVDQSGEVQAFIVDVGGFLGLGEKEIAMSPSNLDIRQDGDTILVFTRFTEDQLTDQPEYDADGFEQNPDEFMMR